MCLQIWEHFASLKQCDFNHFEVLHVYASRQLEVTVYKASYYLTLYPILFRSILC